MRDSIEMRDALAGGAIGFRSAWLVRSVTLAAAIALIGCGNGNGGDGENPDPGPGQQPDINTTDAGGTSGGASSSSGASSSGASTSSSGASSSGASSGNASSGASSSGASSSGASSSGASSSGGSSGAADAGSTSGASDASGSSSGSSSGAADAGASSGSSGGQADAGSAADAGPPPPKKCEVDAKKGDTGAECPAGFVCLTPGGACSGKIPGTCHKKPDACVALVAPVCGCDGKTYSNLCESQKAGAVVEKGGKCAEPVIPCGGKAAKKCPAGMVCEVKSCGAGVDGQCVAAPPAKCPSGGTPECGCDSNTYPNACFRQKAGAALDYVGACLVPPNAKGCKIGPVKPILCPAGEYCKVPVGACAGKGVCVKKPNVCDKSNKPVCGCDKITYGNACLLAKTGFSVKLPEPCPP